jgi:hypothetical protein
MVGPARSLTGSDAPDATTPGAAPAPRSGAEGDARHDAADASVGAAGGPSRERVPRARSVTAVVGLVGLVIGAGVLATSPQEPGSTEAGEPEAQVSLPDEVEDEGPGAVDAPGEAADGDEPEVVCGGLRECVRWTASVEGLTTTSARATSADDGTVVVTNDRGIATFGPEGEVGWSASLDLPDVWGHPVVTDDLVVVLATNELVAHDLSTGEVRWRAEAAGPGVQMLAPPAPRFDDVLVLGIAEPTTGEDDPPPIVLHALDADDGEQLWTREVDQVAGDGTDLAVLDGDELAVVQPRTGDDRWRDTPSWPGDAAPGEPVSPPTAAEDSGDDRGEMLEESVARPWLAMGAGHVLLISHMGDGEVVVTDAESGEEQARHPGRPLLTGPHLLLTIEGAEGQRLVRIGDDAEVVWERALDDEADEGCCALAHAGPGGVALAGPGERVRLLDPADGEVHGEGEAPGELSHVEPVTDRTAVVHGHRERWALDVDGGEELWRVRSVDPGGDASDELYLVVVGGTLYALELAPDAAVGE